MKLFENIQPGTVILTPNRRLSATLHKLYAEYQSARNIDCWTTPDILPVSTWIERTWMEYASAPQSVGKRNQALSPLLLNNTQESFIWENIISENKHTDFLLQEEETAETVKSAWGLLKQWRVDINLPIFHCADDYAALHAWISGFMEYCGRQRYLSHASLPDLLADNILAGDIHMPARIILLGFTELSPQHRYLLAACEKAGSTVENTAHINDAAASARRIRLKDAEQELTVVARWAKQIYTANPKARIGCVIPHLDKARDRVMQIFSSVFANGDSCTIDPMSAPFNISAGKILSQYPVIHTAFELLDLETKKLSFTKLSYLLSSPYLGDAESERIRRARLDAHMRRNNISIIHPDTSEDLADACPRFSQRLQRFYSLLGESRQHQTYHEWADTFSKLLAALGWPGERSMDSEEYQIVSSWLTLLTEFSSLDQVNAPVTYRQALQTLRMTAGKTIFQAKTPEAPIQVLGVLEAAGQPFDYVWMAGMDDLSWPPQPKPNPFIPKQLQRELNMPHATAERELIFCKTLIAQFKQSTANLVFSHTEKNEELELQPSPLIYAVREITLTDLALEPWQSPQEKIFASRKLEFMLDDTAPECEGAVTGGVDVIKQQALCPFKAFAIHRLHAREMESPLPGLRAKDRGSIVHKVMESLWQALKSQATLINMAEQDLQALINNCIENAMAAQQPGHENSPQYLALERQRLLKLTLEWLRNEMKRPPFSIAATEMKCQAVVGPLTLEIRIDRVDELADGGKLIIDYKAGKNNDVNDWFSARPEEPQLPIYALLDNINISGISFAQLYPGEYKFKGASRDSLEIDGVKTISEFNGCTASSWQEQIARWQTVLHGLGRDFHSGSAQVDPKNQQACEWCKLHAFCRINEEMIDL